MRVPHHLGGSGSWSFAKTSSDTAALVSSRDSLVTSAHGRTASTPLSACAAQHQALLQRLAAVEAATASAEPTRIEHLQSVLQPSVIGTRLLKQPSVFDGDRLSCADWGFTFGAYSSAISVRMVRLMEHAQAKPELRAS